MATTIEQIETQLTDVGLKVNRQDDEIVLLFGTDHYVDAEGEKSLLLVVSLDEDGEYFKLFAPGAYEVPPQNAGAFLTTCAMIQFRTKLVQFEWWPERGVIPIVEFPLEDSPLSTRQLHRCVRGLISIIEEYHHALAAAASTGVVDEQHVRAPELARGIGDWTELLDGLPQSVLEEALRRVKERQD